MALLAAPDVSSPRFKADPYPFYARLREEAPVFRTRLAFWLSAWLVTRYEDVAFVLRDERFSKDFSARIRWVTPPHLRTLNRNLLNADPPDHMRLRTLVSKAFTPRTVEGLRDRTQRLCGELLDAAAARGGLELVRAFALRLPLTIIADLLGLPREDRLRFFGWAQRTAAGSSGALLDLLRAQPALWRTVGYFRGLIALRRAEPQDDIVTALLRAEEAGDKLHEDEVIGMVALLLLAGFETTMSLISSGALALLQHPRERERLVDDPSVAETALEELLRYTSPADFATFRIAREDVEIAGVRVPRGGVVLAVIGSANRDERQFPRADVLDLGRAPNRHLAFGSGPHFCLGAALARLEGGLALGTLFRRFPRLRLEVPAESLRWRRGLFFRGLEALPLAV